MAGKTPLAVGGECPVSSDRRLPLQGQWRPYTLCKAGSVGARGEGTRGGAAAVPVRWVLVRCGLLLAVACALMGAPARAQTPSNGTPPAPVGKEAVPGGKDPAPVVPNDRLGPNEGPKEVEGPKVLPKAADAPKVEPAASKTDAAKTGEQPKSADAGKTGEAADAAKTGEPPKTGAADGPAGAKTGEAAAKTEAGGKTDAAGSKTGAGDGKTPSESWETKPFDHTEDNAAKAAAAAKADAEKSPDFSDGLTKIVISLVVIVAIFAAFIWFIRRNPKTRKFFGGGPVKVISRTYIAPRNAMFLVKVGDRVLVIGQSGTEGMRTLSEITDPAEVARLLATAEEANPAGMSATFRDALRSVTGGKTGGPGAGGTGTGGGAAAVITAAPLSARSSQANDSAPSRRASLPPVQSPATDAPPSRVGRKLSVSADEEISVPPMPASRRQKDAEDQTVDPNYSAQLKLAAIRSQLERTKATLK
jgi:flagellar biogenesis protein FliO